MRACPAHASRVVRAMLALAMLLLARDAAAAVVRLAGGGTIEARAWREVGDQLEVTLDGGTLRVAKADVVGIEGMPLPVRAVPAPPPPPVRPAPVAVSRAIASPESPAPPPRSTLAPLPLSVSPPPPASPPSPVVLATRSTSPPASAPPPAASPSPVVAPPSGGPAARPSPSPPPPTAVVEDRSVDEWRKDLASPAVEIRRKAASALAQAVTSADGAGASLLTPALKDADAQVRMTAALTLGRYGLEPQAVTTVLVSTLGATDVARRQTGSAGLVMLGPAAKDAAPALLLAFVNDPDPTVRRNAATALRRIGPTGEEVVPGLTSALRHRDPEVRRAAATLLGDLGVAERPRP